eukprot:GHVO01040670.1.p1 GENE.GHVO01040670.1~~GHVO01040670.1.p1  ORF type:complete len:184 (+),score=37.38 GHVO01040670.1:243-794(+)
MKKPYTAVKSDPRYDVEVVDFGSRMLMKGGMSSDDIASSTPPPSAHRSYEISGLGYRADFERRASKLKGGAKGSWVDVGLFVKVACDTHPQYKRKGYIRALKNDHGKVYCRLEGDDGNTFTTEIGDLQTIVTVGNKAKVVGGFLRGSVVSVKSINDEKLTADIIEDSTNDIYTIGVDDLCQFR